MLLRMVRIHVPIDVMRIVAAGRIACCSTLLPYSQDHSGTSVLSNAKSLGSHVRTTEKMSTPMRPTQKYGTDDVTMKIGVKKLSSLPPRRQPPTTPIALPRTNDSTVVTPTRPMVHGSPVRITSVTGCGK